MLNFSIENLVPKFLITERNGKAMSAAIEAGLKYLCRTTADGIALIDDTETMPSWRCNEVAWEYGAEWYDSTADISEKRAQIDSIRTIYRNIGTKSGLVNAVTSLYGAGCFIQEWNEYSGEPFHYRVYVTNDEAIVSRRNELNRLIGIITNTRSVLDSVQYYGAEGRTDTAYNAVGTVGVYCVQRATALYSGSGGDSGDDDSGDDSGGSSVNDSAILGIGILGIMILGKDGSASGSASNAAVLGMNTLGTIALGMGA